MRFPGPRWIAHPLARAGCFPCGGASGQATSYPMQMRLFLLAVVTATPCVPLAGQTAPTSTSPNEPVVELSPFEVRADRDTGYQANETLAGTRLRTDLKDIAAAVTVLTREFLDDVGAVDNLTVLQYTTNVEVGGTRSTYAGGASGQSVSENVTDPSSTTRVRGLSAADNTRDFFVSDIPWDGYNVDRIEVQRGPNSILFGLGKPAGIVNASLLGAEFRNRTKLENRVGSYGSIRTSLDVNRELLDDQLALRVIGLADHEKYRQEPAFQDDERIYSALRWDPKFLQGESHSTTLRVKFEDGRIRSNNPRTLTPNDNISHFFRPATVSADNPWGGLGKQVFDPYHAATGDALSNNRGQLTASDPDYNPWINANNIVQQQQPVFLIDGATGNLYQAYAGLVPFQVRTSTGAIGGDTIMPAGFPSNSSSFLAVNAPQDFARLYRLPNFESGLYRQWGMVDPTVFDFYNTLIDGPNKQEQKTWDALNIDLAQMAFGGRLGLNLTYDRQAYRTANEGFISGTPSLNVDLTARFQDLAVNPNAGRAFVSGSGGGGWEERDREVMRASLFGEVRASDFFGQGFLSKLLGRHRFNGVYAREEFSLENRSYYLNAAAQSWLDRRFPPATAANEAFDNRRPTAAVYLGPSLLGYNSAAGLNLPGIGAPIAMNDAPLNHYWTVWNAPSSVAFNAAWNRAADPAWSQYPKTGTFVQADNPANYVGWNHNFVLDMVQAAEGQIDFLSTAASKQLRKTESLVGTWQSYWWNDAIVGTLGWRYDVVRSKAVAATRTGTSDHNHLWLSPADPPAGYPSTVRGYRYPDEYATLKDHSLSGGVVVHLNRLVPSDWLPVNVSLAYNQSSNFEVTNRRVDLYGDILDNPSGETEDWSVRVSTKDGKYSARVTRYEASVENSTSSDFNTGSIGAIMATGLAWRNVFKYDLSGYTWNTRNSPGGRNNFAPRPGETAADAAALEAAAIAAWDELQDLVNPALYAAWGFDPNRTADTPEEQAKMANWSSRAPANFAITEDVTAKGMEFELTANPLRNWRISANASKSESFQSNIGGDAIRDYVELITHYMNNTPAGQLRQFSGGATANTFQNIWNSGLYSRWILKRLGEGSAVPEIRKWRYSVTTNYRFTSGRLRNLGLGGSYRWEDKAAIGYPLLITPEGFRYDLDKPYYGPANDSIDLWASYERKLGDKANWKIQLNVRNAFAKKGLIPVTLQPDGTTWAQVRTKPMQEWFLTNTFTF